MTQPDWIIVVIGVVLWGWLFKQMLSPDGYFDKKLPPACTGCRKGAITPRCPVHDPERRRNGEAVSPTERAEAS